MAGRMARAVIGAGWGDEGKGVMVDALAAAAPERPTVVRSNGGAQAGHTVRTPDGRRHVFHHLGSGALAGARTHLSRFFVHHPMLFAAEREAVAALGGETGVSADGRGLVTTPWDMLVNQAAERARGGARHGSCGLGFGETIERGQDAGLRLTVADLAAPDLAGRLQAVRREWVPRRLRALGVAPDAREAAVLADDAVAAVFLEDCRRHLDLVALAPDAGLGAGLGAGGPVIFEGAQGLLLDQAIGVFPHVTRSHTGLVNVLAVAREAGLDGVEALYVTRAYATRHGAGPLPGALPAPEGFEVDDPTNAPNPWQGTIRYAALDLDRLRGAVEADGRLADAGGLSVTARVAVTCLDQARGPVPLMEGAAVSRVSADGVAAVVARATGLEVGAEARGPSRDRTDLRHAKLGLAA